MQEIGIEHTVRKFDFDENIPNNILALDSSLFVAELKSTQVPQIEYDELYIFADTVVVLGNKVLGKPKDRQEAIEILQSLSNHSHLVITGVVIKSENKTVQFKEQSTVFFKNLELSQIEYYIDQYHPYDKAGAYGIQEWIGMIGVYKIEGSYFNIMGLPTDRVYEELLKF